MAKASINFKPIKANSEHHNERKGENLKYVHSDLTPNNESWKADEIDSKLSKIQKFCKEVSGRKLQKNAVPIREGLVNLNGHHTMQDLKVLADELHVKFGIECFQIHIHRDEGVSKDKLNYHAHMVFSWQDLNTGKTLKLHRHHMSKIQTVVASALGMERGELRENSNRERLEVIEYKAQQEELRLQELQEQNDSLEQKKNKVRARIAAARERGKKPEDWVIKLLTAKSLGSVQIGKLYELEEAELSRAIAWVEEQIDEAASKRSS